MSLPRLPFVSGGTGGCQLCSQSATSNKDRPFLTSAAFMRAAICFFDDFTRSSGGFEYLIKISAGGGTGSSGRVARSLMVCCMR